MTMSSFAGVLALGLAASAVPTTHAAPKSSIFPKKDFGKGKPAGPSGAITFGSSDSTTVTNTQSISCGGEVNAAAWANAASAYVEVVKDAVVHGCKGDIKFMTKTMEDEAKAYARVALDTKSKCIAEGNGVTGCSFTEGSGMAHAQAVYDIYAEAFAEASNTCGCAAGAIAAVYTTVAEWDKLFATAMGSVETNVCQTGTGTSEASADVECYARAVAELTAKAAAGAWLKTKVDGEDGVCGPEDMIVECTPDVYEECQADAYAKAKVKARALVEVDETSLGACESGLHTLIDEAGGTGGANTTESFDVSDEEDFTTKVTCIAEGQAKALSKAVNVFVDTAVYATVEKCKGGVEDSANDIGEGVGKAFAQGWIETKAECKIKGDGADTTKGCAYVEAYSKAFAAGVAESWAIADAEAAFEGCKCKLSGTASESVEAGFKAELFANVMLTAGGDIWGENCITEGSATTETELDCMASAMAAFWNKVHAKARIDGQCLLKDKAVCVHEKGDEEAADCFEDNGLYASAVATAMINTDITFNDGFCTGANQGGFFYFDELTGGYTCVKGC